MVEGLNNFLSAGIGAGLMAIVNNVISHRIKKNDKEDERIAALTESQKLLMQDRVRYLGSKFIEEKKISLEDKEMLQAMHKAYQALGGNGHLDTVMREVDKLQIVPDIH